MCYFRNMKNKQITEALGESYYTHCPYPLQDLIPYVTELFLFGLSIVTIAGKLCIRFNKVYKMIKIGLKYFVSDHQSNKHLTYRDRRYIEFAIRHKMTKYQIAKVLKCSQSTIANELKRGQGSSFYNANYAQEKYLSKLVRSSEPKKLEQAKAFLEEWQEAHEKDLESPVSFTGKMKSRWKDKDSKVSATTIYHYIHKGYLKVKPDEMPMIPKRKNKSGEFEVKDGKHTQGNSIDLRPDVKDLFGNYLFGNWEIDCVCGSKDKNEPVLLTLLEKKTRFFIIRKIRSQSQECVHAALREIFSHFSGSLNKIFKTITADNGSEFLKLYKMKELKGKVFYCHPGAPKERAQNERHNGILRMFIPKGDKISGYSEREIQHAETAINCMYRVALNNDCAVNLFYNELIKNDVVLPNIC